MQWSDRARSYSSEQNFPLQVSLANNDGLCGMIPNSVRSAHGFNMYKTSLGKPCPGDTAFPPKLTYATYAWPI